MLLLFFIIVVPFPTLSGLSRMLPAPMKWRGEMPMPSAPQTPPSKRKSVPSRTLSTASMMTGLPVARAFLLAARQRAIRKEVIVLPPGTHESANPRTHSWLPTQ